MQENCSCPLSDSPNVEYGHTLRMEARKYAGGRRNYRTDSQRIFLGSAGIRAVLRNIL